MPNQVILLAASHAVLAVASTAFIGVGTALFAYFGRPYYWSAISYLEADFTDKLRRMHVSTGSVRSGLIGWSATVSALLFGLWLFGDSLVFALLSATLLFCGPWFLVRRMAEKHRQKLGL